MPDSKKINQMAKIKIVTEPDKYNIFPVFLRFFRFSFYCCRISSNKGSKPTTAIMSLAHDMIRGELPTELQYFHPAIRKVLEFLAQNFDDEISVEELTQVCCLSASYLSFLFRETFSVSLKVVISIFRIEMAKQLLFGQPYREITEIYSEVGFRDLTTFERNFKGLIGCSPKEYQQQVRERGKSAFSNRS